MNLTDSDVQRILKLIDSAEHLDEVEIVHEGFRLHVVRNGGGVLPRQSHAAPGPAPAAVAAMPAAQSAPSPAPAPRAAGATVPEGAIAIRAPMLGTFYRAASPGEKPFVEVGQRVRADDTVCLIEVMKLFNTIRAGVDGEISQILVENGGMVEFDQPLIFVTPSKKKG
jgi:acetyl-CoA carboxylase biotin carboxyl carrier protein